FGYVNFNNQIASQEFSQFKFPVTGDGVPYFLGVGQFQQGPNSLAPQQTYQDNFQNKYDGSYTTGNHTLRYGGEINRIVLGGFSDFAGPLSLAGVFTTLAEPHNPVTRGQIIVPGGDAEHPTRHPPLTLRTCYPNPTFT